MTPEPQGVPLSLSLLLSLPFSLSISISLYPSPLSLSLSYSLTLHWPNRMSGILEPPSLIEISSCNLWQTQFLNIDLDSGHYRVFGNLGQEFGEKNFCLGKLPPRNSSPILRQFFAEFFAEFFPEFFAEFFAAFVASNFRRFSRIIGEGSTLMILKLP